MVLKWICFIHEMTVIKYITSIGSDTYFIAIKNNWRTYLLPIILLERFAYFNWYSALGIHKLFLDSGFFFQYCAKVFKRYKDFFFSNLSIIFLILF